MILDLYYKLLWWYAAIRANLGQVLNVEQFRVADGKWYTYIWGGYPTMNDPAEVASKSIFTKPTDTMISQAAELPQNYDIYKIYGNLIVGSGSTPVTKEDYMMESEIVSGLSCSAVEVDIDHEAKSISFRKIMTNTGSEDITIREIGYAVPVCVGLSDKKTQSASRQGLVYREVLEEPMVIGAGETGTVVVTIHHVLPF